ncbi:MAG: choice-of-anchor J domain-containing protein [Bacteroidales bacterium]|nr:choice-of-anchor J domain-containing protein [Bacteroidales bacterium]
MKKLALTLAILFAFVLGGVAQQLSFDFEDGTLQGWTVLDGDGDGHCWEPSIGGMGHNSNGMVMAYSKDYATGDSLAPNEYLVSPRLVLSEDWPVIHFYACALDEIYPAEHFGVSISTTVNDDPLAFTLLSQWTIAAKDAGNRQGNWYNYTVDLSAYTGQEVYVAIRHHYCAGQSAICVDDIQIEGEIVVAQNSLWKPLNLPGSLMGVNAQGDLFCRNVNVYPSTLVRSQDEGETWETVFDSSFGNLAIGKKGRMFLICDRIVNYSDDNGDTWQQTSPINEGTGYNWFNSMKMRSPSNDTLVGYSAPYLTWTLDGGVSWDSTRIAFMEDHQEISDLLVNENGDVYVSIWYYIGPNIGVYHSTLSDMHNWELVAFEDVGVKDMAFDPEGNVICGVYFGGDFSGYEHVPGFYAYWSKDVSIADNGIIYKTSFSDSGANAAVLAYSLDHGEHFYNTVGDLPLLEPAPGGDDGFLSKGQDNHLYFLGNNQYWKSIPNANDIPNVIAFPSEWYYEIQNENGSITYQYICQAGDTIVGDEPSHILVKINTLYDKGLREDVTREYVYMRDGKVYWWNKTLEEFTVLYDFGAQEGDTWVTKVGTETLIMHVNSVETVEYEGKTYRMLHVSDADDYFSGDIVCGIGHLTSFFPERLMDNGDGIRVEGLRCYWIEDELVFKPGDEDCDAIYSEVHGVEEDGPSMDSGNAFTVYPNPTNGVLTIQHSEFHIHHSEFQIANLMGQTVLSGNINAENQQIDVSSLPQGMYFITFAGETRKFVVR